MTDSDPASTWGATMRMLSVTEQVRLTSIRMLRGFFTGVGQLLMAADRFRTEAESELERADSNGAQDPLGGWENDGTPVAEPAQITPPPPPIPGYDDFSLASLRARLRGLSVSQLDQLIDYEKAHANRAEVVTLFERRIAKLKVGQH